MDKFWMQLAWLLPKQLVKWAYVRLHVHATTAYPSKVIDDISCFDAMKAW